MSRSLTSPRGTSSRISRWSLAAFFKPLTFSPNYQTSLGYDENIVLFSTMVTSATKAGGADFGANSRIYEVALVSAVAANDLNKDTVFSRTNFNPIQYNSSYNFTITWGVRILLP
jgi:hypothetical protein